MGQLKEINISCWVYPFLFCFVCLDRVHYYGKENWGGGGQGMKMKKESTSMGERNQILLKPNSTSLTAILRNSPRWKHSISKPVSYKHVILERYPTQILTTALVLMLPLDKGDMDMK